MALEFSTIGVKLGYCVETTAGSRPTTGYTNVPDIKSVPDITNSPNTIDVTNLIDTKRRYIDGVADVGGDFAFDANLTASLNTTWASCVAAANTAWASGKATWFEISIPNFDSFYFAGKPVDLGVKGMSVDAVVEASLHIVPNQIAGWAAASA